MKGIDLTQSEEKILSDLCKLVEKVFDLNVRKEDRLFKFEDENWKGRCLFVVRSYAPFFSTLSSFSASEEDWRQLAATMLRQSHPTLLATADHRKKILHNNLLVEMRDLRDQHQQAGIKKEVRTIAEEVIKARKSTRKDIGIRKKRPSTHDVKRKQSRTDTLAQIFSRKKPDELNRLQKISEEINTEFINNSLTALLTKTLEQMDPSVPAKRFQFPTEFSPGSIAKLPYESALNLQTVERKN